MHSSGFFRIKLIARLILKREISGSHTISDQSLLLSTIVLNDTRNNIYYNLHTNTDIERAQFNVSLKCTISFLHRKTYVALLLLYTALIHNDAHMHFQI